MTAYWDKMDAVAYKLLSSQYSSYFTLTNTVPPQLKSAIVFDYYQMGSPSVSIREYSYHCIHIDTCIIIHVHAQEHAYARPDTYVNARARTHIHTHTHTCTHSRILAITLTSYTHTFTYTHTHTRAITSALYHQFIHNYIRRL